jgi:hypothetical protein
MCLPRYELEIQEERYVCSIFKTGYHSKIRCWAERRTISGEESRVLASQVFRLQVRKLLANTYLFYNYFRPFTNM